ncbi:putative F-box protein At5g50220 [Capsicum annuum]|uniref:putative F-box protein At5g50220 n=1 Tax=Capsicum annuum TaxID=4072 RepID=UPI001FB190B9|nr:putative F-box protein At5g50220 [Capsicum annuum]
MSKKRLVKRQPDFEDDMSIFSCDILYSNIIRLPVKSLLRFQSVSKPWRAMISDSEFKKSHRDHSKALEREKILLGRKTGEFEFGELENSELVIMEKQWIPRKKFHRAQVLCSCEGLESATNHPVVPLACGLCYDSGVDDYKVIIMMSYSFYGVYSLNNNSWTEKKVFPYPAKSYATCSPLVSIEGRVFWFMHHRAYPYVDRTSTIIYFDIKSVEVKELPIGFVGEDEIFQLFTLRSCLCLYGGKKTDKESNIWIMEQDGNWKWLMNVCNLPTICQGVQDMKLLCCTKDGEVVFQGVSCHQLFIYNPKRQQFVTVGVREHESPTPPIASICFDSLYFSTSRVRRRRKQRFVTPNNQTTQ